MKKIIKLTLFGMMIFAFAFFAVSCGKDNKPEKPTVSDSELSFIVKGAVLEVGETFVIEYEKTGDGEIEWKSSDESIAEVEDGTVTAVGEGVAEVTGKAGGASDVFTVKVEKQTSVPSLKLSAKEIDLVVGEKTSVILKAEYKGKEAKAESLGINIEEGGDFADISINGTVVSVEAKRAGRLSAIVYAEIFGTTAAERLVINIKESVPFIVVSNAKPAADGYEAEVAAIENPEIPQNFKPSADIWHNGKVLSDAEVEWTMQDNDFVGYGEDGYFGKKAGSAVIIGTYKDQSVRLTIKCVRPVFTRTDEILTVELADGLKLDNVEGVVCSVKADDREMLNSADEEGNLTFKLNELTISDYNTEKKVVVYTDVAAYEHVFRIYTDIITDESELNDFLKNSLASATAPSSANGYFILGNDIVCTGEYKAYESYPFGVQSSNGFQGIFDGNGKIIKNLNVTGEKYCGFIPMLGISGVLKNVIFLNGKLSGNGSFISCHSFGRLENVYIEAEITDNSEKMKNVGDRRMYASVLASESDPHMIVKNVFVKYLNVVDENSNAGHLFVLGDCKPEGLIVVGHKKYHIKTWGSFSDENARTYLTEEEFISAKADWETLTADYSSLVFNVTDDGILPARRI